MERITKQDREKKYYIVEERISLASEQINPIENAIVINEKRGYGKPIDKLGRLEDIEEEELECSLEVVFIALRNGIYYQTNGYLVRMRGVKLEKLNGWCLTDGNHYADTKDYKKTWWLKEGKSE